MSEFIKITTKSGKSLFFQVSSQEADGQAAVVGGRAAIEAEKVISTASDLGDSIKDFFEDIIESFGKIERFKPESIELSFGIKLEGEGSIYVVKAKGEAAIEVKLVWKP